MGQTNIQKEVSASARHVRISAQKARLVCDGVRGMKLEQALHWLEYTPKKASGIIKKLLKSAIANAENNNGLDVDDLYLKTIYANEAPQLKRFAARAKGRGNRIIKRSSHITVVVATNNRETK